jgi:hypothetical protein
MYNEFLGLELLVAPLLPQVVQVHLVVLQLVISSTFITGAKVVIVNAIIVHNTLAYPGSMGHSDTK